MLLTLKCLSVAFLSGFIVGVPLVWLFRRGKALSQTDWLYAPFVGLGVITLVTHQLVYFDVRVLHSAPALWGAALALWFGLSVRYGWRTVFRNCPWPVLGATLGVYLVHALGVLIAGPDGYVGRAQGDRINYNSLAQFLIDVPFSTDWNQLGQRPYLVDGMKVKQDRIGVMALQAFFSVTAAEWASRLFDPTILLAPALTVPALMLLCRRLGFDPREALLTALAGGLVPGLAALHTRCYLANAVAVPFFFVATAATALALTRPSPRRVALAVLTYAATASLYTEFVPLLLAVAVGGAGFAALFGRCGRLAPFALAMLVCAAALAVSPRAAGTDQLEPIRRALFTPSSFNPLEWLYFNRLLGSVWGNDIVAQQDAGIGPQVVMVIGAAFTVFGVVGLLRLLRATLTRRGSRPNTGAVAALLIGSLVIGPFVIQASGRFDYAGTKLWLSFAPLWVVCVAGFVLLHPARARQTGANPWAAVVGALRPVTPVTPPSRGLIALTALAAAFGFSTTVTILMLTSAYAVPYSCHGALTDPALDTVRFKLKSIPVQNVVLAVGPGPYHNSDLALAARRHKVWLVCPELNDGTTLGNPRDSQLRHTRHMTDLSTLPNEALVLTVRGKESPVRIDGDKTLLDAIGPYELYRVGPRPYTLTPTKYAKRPPELDHPAPVFAATKRE